MAAVDSTASPASRQAGDAAREQAGDPAEADRLEQEREPRAPPSSVSAATTTSLSGSTTQAARVPTAARTIVTLIEPGTWAASYSTRVAPVDQRRARLEARLHGGREERVDGLRAR